jgi:hypothetical protein
MPHVCNVLSCLQLIPSCNIHSTYNITCSVFRYLHIKLNHLLKILLFPGVAYIAHSWCCFHSWSSGLLTHQANKYYCHPCYHHYVGYLHYIPETNHVTTVYTVAAVLYLRSLYMKCYFAGEICFVLLH